MVRPLIGRIGKGGFVSSAIFHQQNKVNVIESGRYWTKGSERENGLVELALANMQLNPRTTGTAMRMSLDEGSSFSIVSQR